MSRHHRKFVRDINVPGKKAQEREQRMQAARQRMRFHTFVALALLCFDKWRHNPDLQEDIAGFSPNERRYYKMQTAKCFKRIQCVIRYLHEKSAYPKRPTNAFFEDASTRIQRVLFCVCDAPSMPETCRYTDVHAIVTYLVYVALHEWGIMDTQNGNAESFAFTDEYESMMVALRQFCDHAIPADSPFVAPMNEAYRKTRDLLHSGAPVPHYENVPEVA